MLENGMYKKLVPGITICLYILPGDVAEGQTVDVVPVELTHKLDQLRCPRLNKAVQTVGGRI